MYRVLIYSGLLLAGMGLSQAFSLSAWQLFLHTVTMICLSYIMVEVGLEFVIDKSRVRSYAVDYWIAATAAAFPWIFCAVYFMMVLNTPWKEAWLVGRFAAPTSAGVLFTMLAAAGLSATWVFKKARILAIFDDLDTVLLMIPLQILFIGMQWQLGIVAGFTLFSLIAAYRWMNRLAWPTTKFWILLYGIVITAICKAVEVFTHVHLEVLLPAFTLGCLIHHKGTVLEGDDPHSWLDQGIKALFMFLVGCSLPRIAWDTLHLGSTVLHVIGLTALSNIGKCFPLFFYRDEANLRERLALCVAMFPRGEVGAGVLLVAMSYGLGGVPVALGSLSLAVNLLLTAIFIRMVVNLTKKVKS